MYIMYFDIIEYFDLCLFFKICSKMCYILISYISKIYIIFFRVKENFLIVIIF